VASECRKDGAHRRRVSIVVVGGWVASTLKREGYMEQQQENIVVADVAGANSLPVYVEKDCATTPCRWTVGGAGRSLSRHRGQDRELLLSLCCPGVPIGRERERPCWFLFSVVVHGDVINERVMVVAVVVVVLLLLRCASRQ